MEPPGRETRVGVCHVRWGLHRAHSTELRGGVGHRSAKASGSEDLEIEQPGACRDLASFHFHPTRVRMLGAALVGDQVVQMNQTGEEPQVTPTWMVEAFHGKQLAVNSVVRLIQQRAAGRHPWVFEHRIPACFLILEPVAHPLTVLRSNGGRDVSGKTA